MHQLPSFLFVRYAGMKVHTVPSYLSRTTGRVSASVAFVCISKSNSKTRKTNFFTYIYEMPNILLDASLKLLRGCVVYDNGVQRTWDFVRFLLGASCRDGSNWSLSLRPDFRKEKWHAEFCWSPAVVVSHMCLTVSTSSHQAEDRSSAEDVRGAFATLQ